MKARTCGRLRRRRFHLVDPWDGGRGGFESCRARLREGSFNRRATGRCPPKAGWRWAGGGILDEGGGPDLARDEEGTQLVERKHLALIDMDDGSEGDFLMHASEHGGAPRGSPLESGTSPARALELAEQGLARLDSFAFQAGGASEWPFEGSGTRPRHFGHPRYAGAGSQAASTQNLSVDAIQLEVDELMLPSLERELLGTCRLGGVVGRRGNDTLWEGQGKDRRD
ncbi:hypothetical protein CYMTET_5646 [Cymbomonas tetramitiformis]|uniref:Uncharacterized protein n=1 Tax=Cymbomonas tetramitiformis TaxID=36881 RepID=A0AAE0LIN2_9CHLO|nr:hypothetical protein CYMTET_5646 [Cymbomonas tetramitiformis]